MTPKSKRIILSPGTQGDYLLNDNFDSLSLSTNSNAIPGPGLRKIVNTENKIKPTNGRLVFTGAIATPTDGNPGIWWNSVKRTAGCILLGLVRPLITNGTGYFGWFGVQSGANEKACIRVRSTTFFTADSSASAGPDIFAYVANTDYKLAIILRTTGAFIFAKGGTLTNNWNLLWYLISDTTATLFPGFPNFNQTFQLDNIKIPKQLWLPAPLASDSFNRANGALGTTNGVGHLEANGGSGLTWTGSTYAITTNAAVGTPTVGSDVIVNGAFAADTDWTKGAGWSIAAGVAAGVTASSDLTAAVAPLASSSWYQSTFTLSGFGAGTVQVVIGTTALPTHGADGTFTETGIAATTAFLLRGSGFTGSIDNVICKALTFSSLMASLVTSTQDVVIEVNVTGPTSTSGIQGGIVVNLDSAASPANFVVAYLDGNGTCKLDKFVAGVRTNVISGAITYSAGNNVGIIKQGTSYTLFYNRNNVGSTATISDAGIINNTLHGLFSTSASNSFDNFQCWARGTNNEYGILNKWLP